MKKDFMLLIGGVIISILVVALLLIFDNGYQHVGIGFLAFLGSIITGIIFICLSIYGEKRSKIISKILFIAPLLIILFYITPLVLPILLLFILGIILILITKEKSNIFLKVITWIVGIIDYLIIGVVCFAIVVPFTM